MVAMGTEKSDETRTYWHRLYADCSNGPFSPFRDHATEFGWGILHQPTGRIFGYVGSKGACFGVCAALNEKWEAAKIYIEGSSDIPDDYFDRFRKI